MSPDSRQLVVGDGDGNITLFDTFVGYPVTSPLHVEGAIYRVRFRPGSPREFVVQSGGGVRVQALPWPPAVPLPVSELSSVRALAARPARLEAADGPADAGEALVAAGRSVAVFRAGEGRRLKNLRVAEETLAAAFHPTRNILVRGFRGGWGAVDLDTGATTSHPFPGYVYVRSIAFRPGGSGEVFVNKADALAVYPADCAGPPLRELKLAGVLRPGGSPAPCSSRPTAERSSSSTATGSTSSTRSRVSRTRVARSARACGRTTRSSPRP